MTQKTPPPPSKKKKLQNTEETGKVVDWIPKSSPPPLPPKSEYLKNNGTNVQMLH